MGMENTIKLERLIHVGKKLGKRGSYTYLFLRQVEPHIFTWFEVEKDFKENATHITSPSIEEAMRLAQRDWASDYFRTIICGFRYTLPERDEHGLNALFFQMVASYSSSNGIYFDEELGCNCIVHQASQEARNLWNLIAARY
jgi:hypothetical protein